MDAAEALRAVLISGEYQLQLSKRSEEPFHKPIFYTYTAPTTTPKLSTNNNTNQQATPNNQEQIISGEP
jgi:hypothetical protein